MFEKRFRDRINLQQLEGLHRNPPVIEKREGRFVTIKGQKVLSFASNDYLGLGASHQLAAQVGKHFKAGGSSASSSRLVAGNYQTICRAEKTFADYFGYEDALFFPSGYQANLAILPQAHALAAVAALELVEQADNARKIVKDVSESMGETLVQEGFQVFGNAHIISVLMGDEKKAAQVSQDLLSRGILAFSARFPTVPLGKAILRLGMTALHRDEDIKIFVNKLKEVV